MDNDYDERDFEEERIRRHLELCLMQGRNLRYSWGNLADAIEKIRYAPPAHPVAIGLAVSICLGFFVVDFSDGVFGRHLLVAVFAGFFVGAIYTMDTAKKRNIVEDRRRAIEHMLEEVEKLPSE